MQLSFPKKIGGAILVAAGLLCGSIAAGNLLLPVETPTVTTQDFPGLLAAATTESGAKAFKKCKSCHTTGLGGANTIGPNLWDVVGRSKAASPGFAYSAALKKIGGAWSYEDLDAFLSKPKKYAPGTKMSFAGIKKAPGRAAVIAYLRSLSETPKPLP